MRKSLIALSLCTVLCLSGCGSSAHTPFTCTDYQSMQYNSVVDELTKSGFTNIETVSKETSIENDANRVYSISIDGKSSFVSAERYDADTPVTVRYYVYVAPAPEATATPEPSAEPEAAPVDKDIAITLDAALAGVTAGMEEEYNSFLSSFANGEISSDLSAYNAAKALSADIATACNTLLSSKALDNDEYISYVCAVVEYGYAMQAVADDTMVYIDDGKTSSLSAVQDAITAAQKPMLSVATTRLAFLQAAGCTADEIDSILEGQE